jgi:two-component system, NarL family, sensor kinase
MNQEQAKLYTAILIGCLVITIIIIYFAVSLVRHQRRALAFNRKNLLQEITTLEKDRSRMAADLHDELGPLLSQVKFRVNSLEVHDPEDQEQLETSSRQIDEVIERIRGIARNLMPGSLLKKGLHTAIKEFVEGLNRNGRVEVHYFNESKLMVDEEKSINIFRTLQEICQNTLKHAKASHLLIKFYDKGNTLHIICEDNGTGFNYEKVYEENRGLGLRNLKSRIDIMGGKLFVTSEEGKGTQYAMAIPVEGGG